MKHPNILLIISIFLFSSSISVAKGKQYTLQSPDSNIEITVTISNKISYSVKHRSQTIISDSDISMTLNDGRVFGHKPLLKENLFTQINGTLESPFYRSPSIDEKYNQMELIFKGGYSLHFRAYNQGIAYRFSTNLKEDFSVVGEDAQFCFDSNNKCYIPYSSNIKQPFQTSFESRYNIEKIDQFDTNRVAILPLLVELDNGKKVIITESDLESYAGMFLSKMDDKYGFKGTFAGIPSEIDINPVRLQEKVKKYSGTIANVKGTRTFPWRIVAIAEKDTELPVNDLVYLLGSPNRIQDISWIKPGRAAWDWWNNWGITGVDFPVGINTETYKYIIDFAAAYGIEYIVIDEGWYDPKVDDLMTTIPEIDLKELCSYGEKNGVGIILWTVAFVLDHNLEQACKHYSEMGIKGFKVDFMDRDDQQVVELNYRLLDMAAKYNLVLDLHGMYKPTGLNRTYPNLLNYEGVWGLEQMKWSKEDQMTYDVTFPYIRMMAGPVDYTQGAMRNGAINNFAPIYNNPMSQGTRAHQVATYIVFDSPLVMLADSPSAYLSEEESVEFISSIPCIWEETKILGGEIGQYIVSARKSGEKWYIGGLTGLSQRELTIDLSFINSSNDNNNEIKYSIEIFKDGKNAHKQGIDYKTEKMIVPSNDSIKIQLAPGGGFAIIVSPI